MNPLVAVSFLLLSALTVADVGQQHAKVVEGRTLCAEVAQELDLAVSAGTIHPDDAADILRRCYDIFSGGTSQ